MAMVYDFWAGIRERSVAQVAFRFRLVPPYVVNGHPDGDFGVAQRIGYFPRHGRNKRHK